MKTKNPPEGYRFVEQEQRVIVTPDPLRHVSVKAPPAEVSLAFGSDDADGEHLE